MSGFHSLARLAAATGASALAALGLASPGFAHDESKGERHKSEKIIVIKSDGDRLAHRGRGDRVRRIRTFHLDAANMVDCDGEKTAVSEVRESEGDKTRVIFCSKDELSGAQRIEKLEQVLSRLSTSDRLSAEQRERVTTALREAIEQMRTAP